MTIELLRKANELTKDIEIMKKQLNDVKEKRHYIVVSTPDYQNCLYSCRFQNELIEWLSAKKEEYQKEFDELKE